MRCSYCGKEITSKGNRKYCEVCVPSNLTKNERSNKIRYLSKKKMVNMFGGKCCLCGYNKCVSALDFHHMDKTTKEFDISKYTNSCDFSEELIEELKKCVLLCANCHRYLHSFEYKNKIK
ncbi:MAG: hypothetical protein HUJ68_03110 [Clostridia bacterium]|nr:hypothetical protein [Clostridia bacterium]